MKSVRKRRFLKSVALFLAFNLLVEIFFPTCAWALTDGPKQPEYSSFEPVSTTNMVSDFSGSFTYNLPVVNIPGPNGSGYALSLSYHSGNTSESEASWVGHGWSLNPGAINRNLQGIPDDNNGEESQQFVYYNKRKPNISLTAARKLGLEAYSIDASFEQAFTYNNYRGFGSKLSVGLGVGYGMVSVGYTVSGQEPGSFNAEINPGALLKVMGALKHKEKQASTQKTNEKKTTALKGAIDRINKEGEKRKNNKNNKTSFGKKAIDKLSGIKFGATANTFGMSTTLNQYSDNCFTVNFEHADGIDPILFHIGAEFGFRGSLSYLENQAEIYRSKRGLLYSSADDYSVEKESPYNVRDRYLPIPHKAKDQFIMTGEIASGGFSLVDPNLSQAEIQTQNNNVTIRNIALDNNVGLNLGTGFNAGLGMSRSEVRSFDYSFPSSAGFAPYFRFNNDLGGSVVFSDPMHDQHRYTSSIEAPYNSLSGVDYSNMHVSALSNRPGGAGFIGYSTKGDRSEARKKYFSSTQDPDALGLLTNGNVLDSKLADIYTVLADGSKQVYGLPVYVSGEAQVSEDVLEKGTFVSEAAKDIFLKKNPSVETKLGQNVNSTYATTFLLTQINSSDYIDRKLDGPTDDDFGGWTKFVYRDPAYVASGGKGFHFRSPYLGMNYNQGELTDKDDDLGSYQSGDKEMYYLKYVETKTHIAFFVTNMSDYTYTNDYGTIAVEGSGNYRHDGLEAPDNINAQKGSLETADKRSEYLEKIMVFSKTDIGGKPLSVVNFDYSYELAPGVLNHICSDEECPEGKLTLKKVWFEYEGVMNAKIAPYEFKYEYKLPSDFHDEDLISKYSDIVHYGEELTSTDQNPNYNTWALDGWGNYQKGGALRSLNKQDWVNQKPDAHFDPAAWHLKQIKLPSGGEILIQYEQHDYRFVQDQPALAMVNLEGSINDLSYTINTDALADLEVEGNETATLANKMAYVEQLNAYLKKEKIYFKFLYSLFGEGALTLENCKNEFITGFANATAVLTEDDKINIQISGDGNNAPKQVCKWFVKRKVAGKPINSNCNVKNVDVFFPQNSMSRDFFAVQNKIVSLFDKVQTDSRVRELAEDDLNGFLGNVCPSMSLTNSYFRIPVFKAKKGGGTRVKRILMYDQGIEAAVESKDRDEVLYGTEYFYEDASGLSSGVATNEPNSFREENALVRSLVQRNDPTWKEKMIAGIDRETFEGPLGEQLLPSPSIGYSRVVSQSIHSGKSGTGFKVSEYHTCKDFPFKAKNSSVRAPGSTKFNIPAVFVIMDVDIRAASQSYEFLINDMHGKLKSIRTYRGAYIHPESEEDVFPVDQATFTEVHEYFGLEDKVNVMDESGTITPDFLGKEETITFENRHAKDEYIGMATQFDISVGINFPPPVVLPQFSGMGYVSYSLKEFHAAVFNKTISITAMEKSVTTIQDGVTHVKENKVFNKYNGHPIVVDTYDGYHGLSNLNGEPGTHNGIIRSHTLPAHYVYANMGQKVKNEQRTFSGKSFNASLNKLTVGTDVQHFVSGDLLVLSNGNHAYYYVDEIVGNDLMLVELSREGHSNGTVNGSVNVRIVNSGYTNQLDGDAASVMTYGAGAIGGTSEIYDGASRSLKTVNQVLSSSVNTYSSDWNSDYVRTWLSDRGLNENDDDDYSLGMKGKWRMKSQSVFNSPVQASYGSSDERIYENAGTYTMGSYNFYGSNGNQWIKSSIVNAYSPDGNMLEDQNALGVKSSSEFSHKNTVPAYIAKNAPLGSCTYLSYEDDASASTEKAHTGRRSLKLFGSTSSDSSRMVLDAGAKSKPVIVRFWMHASNEVMEDVNKHVKVNVQDESQTTTISPKLTRIAQVGEWTLYEGMVRGLSLVVDNSFTVTLSSISSETLYIDDFRYQPVESEMVCYAYDGNSMRLIATFDDQHFGLLYQYNGEGKLVRKLVETERGMKTISETQYNVPKQAR